MDDTTKRAYIRVRLEKAHDDLASGREREIEQVFSRLRDESDQRYDRGRWANWRITTGRQRAGNIGGRLGHVDCPGGDTQIRE